MELNKNLLLSILIGMISAKIPDIFGFDINTIQYWSISLSIILIFLIIKNNAKK